VASVYGESPLNMEGAGLEEPLARPGAAAPDGRLGDRFLVDRLQGEFMVGYFGGEGPAVADTQCFVVPKGESVLHERYGVEDRATYVFRPDGHVLARCAGIDGAFARAAIEHVLSYRRPAEVRPAVSLQPACDRLFDTLSAELDAIPAERRAAHLAPAIARLEQMGTVPI
jgi:hypothetical protein